ncbi:MAG TPA: alkaline phosphatase D family protein [Vicinamibacterales bacterium]|nr:alkaline phosphatase D family protein [Vicinamibacterales bacterium]
MRRREFLKLAAGLPAFAQAPAIVSRARPIGDAGVSAGPAGSETAIVWAHVDRPSRMIVEYATTSSFANARRVRGTNATASTGLTARAKIGNIAGGQEVFYRLRFEDAADTRIVSEPVAGHFRSSPTVGRPVRIAWSADVCGQGWGIDTARGGMRLFKTMADANPDLFVHVGDTIYADGPLAAEVKLDDGTLWRNLVTPAKSKVAETLDEFRGNHLYNRLDEHYRRFAAEVAQVVMWDDHEVRDNWYHAQTVPEKTPYPYTERRVAVLAERARQAFLENYPVAMTSSSDTLIYRRVPMGPLVEIFALDMRSHRGSNSENLQASMTADTAFLGSRQARWLADALARSRATWKIVAADMPLGLVVAHRPGEHEAVANGDPGPPRGRELEIAGLLRTLQERKVRNVVWVTADVHYCAAHHYDPERAAFKDFDPFWEFIAGPAHAGTFAPGPFDGTFGPEMRFCGVPADLKPNRPPDAGWQFFGWLEADPSTRALTVSLINTAGQRVFQRVLEPIR